MNNELNKILDLALNELKKCGEDAKLKEGDEFVTIFNNCVLFLGVEDEELKVKLVGGEPCRVDYDVTFFKEAEK